MRPRSAKAAAAHRRRLALVKRQHGPVVCERCHAEPAVDVHELVRRSQAGGAAEDLDLMVPIGRDCHDWIGLHPAEAEAEGWAVWGWQARQPVTYSDTTPIEVSSYGMSPRANTGRVAITVKLDPADIAWLDSLAGTRSDAVRRVIRALRAPSPTGAVLDPTTPEVQALADEAEAGYDPATITQRPIRRPPPAQGHLNPVTGRPRGPVPKTGKP